MSTLAHGAPPNLTKVGDVWSVTIPGTVPGHMVRFELNERSKLCTVRCYGTADLGDVQEIGDLTDPCDLVAQVEVTPTDMRRVAAVITGWPL